MTDPHAIEEENEVIPFLTDTDLGDEQDEQEEPIVVTETDY